MPIRVLTSFSLLMELQKQRIALSFNDKYARTTTTIFPPASEMVFIKAENVYSDIFLNQDFVNNYQLNVKSIFISKSIGYFEKLLEPMGFVRIHKSYLINILYVKSYQNNGFIRLYGYDKVLRVSSEKQNELLSTIQKICVSNTA